MSHPKRKVDTVEPLPTREPSPPAGDRGAGTSLANDLGAAATSAAQAAGVGAALSVVDDLVEGRQVDLERAARAGLAGGGRAAAEEGLRRSLEGALTRRAPGLLAGEIAKEAAKLTVKEAARSALRTNGVTAAAALLVDQACDTVAVARGAIDGREYLVRSGANVAGAGGSLAGASSGAAIGTALLPGPGTALGALLGGCLGAWGARASVRGLFGRRGRA